MTPSTIFNARSTSPPKSEAGGVHNVDLAALEDDGGVFGQDGDAPLPLQLVRVHHALGHLLVGAEGSALPQHGVYEGCLAVVHMGDDGDIAYRLSHREFSFFWFGRLDL
jgi:hypothetical protein